jgi:signal transduction histidine kinase/cell division protein FtsL
MMMFNTTALRSKVARRILGVFLLCALVPFAGLAIFSYHQVSAFFNEKTQRQLRAMAKTFGMDIYERLLLSKASLGIIASRIDSDGKIASEETLELLPDRPKERWKALAVITANGQHRRLFGDAETLPEVPASEREHLVSGKALLMIQPSTPHAPARIFMSLIADPQQTDYRILLGEIKETYLWGIGHSRILPSYIKPCVIDPSGATLMCSNSDFNRLPEALVQKIKHTDVSDFEWRQDGKDYQASYWTISNTFEFRSSRWIVVLHTSKEGIFASIAELKNTFLLWIVVCTGLSLLLAIYQFRKRLTPVEKLQEGTRRIAQRDFDFRVKVSSGDEFEDLAMSLNAMSGQLGHQFNTIATTGEIDRAVLSLLDTSKIVEVILARIMDYFHCDFGTLTLFGSESDRVQQWLLRRERNFPELLSSGQTGETSSGSAPASNQAVSIYFTQEVWPQAWTHDKDPLAYEIAAAKTIIVASDIHSHPRLRESGFLREWSFASCLGAPLVVKGDVLGVMSFYSEEPRTFRVEEIDFVNGLTNQAAIAIYNSQLYERTKQQSIELEKANRVKDEFLGIISHELRTPLNIILGYVRVVQEGVLGDVNADQAKALETISRRSNQLLEMIESIMNATMIEAGAVEIENRQINLLSFLESLKSKCAVPVDKEVTVSWKHSPDLPLLISDEAKLKRILLNLIENAIKFTEKGEVTISTQHIPEQQLVKFMVADTGIGIPQESIPLIFDLFRQQDSSETREYEGLGLGLYIVKKLTDLIGGTVSVESKVEYGSIFTVELPTTHKENIAKAA